MYIKAIRDCEFVKTGKVYKMEMVDNQLNLVIIANEGVGPKWAEFPIDMFVPFIADVIHVDFVKRMRVA